MVRRGVAAEMPNPGDVITFPNCACCGGSSSSSSSVAVPCPFCPTVPQYQFTLTGIGGTNNATTFCSSLNGTWTVTAPGFATGSQCSWEAPVPLYQCGGPAGSYRWEWLLLSVSSGVFTWRLRLVTGTTGDPTWDGTSTCCEKVVVTKRFGEACCRNLNFPFPDTYTFPTTITMQAVPSTGFNCPCCSLEDPFNLNCIYNTGTGYLNAGDCTADTVRKKNSITATSSVFGPITLSASSCRSWIFNYCTTSGAATYIVAELINNVWSVIWPCPSPVFFGQCSGNNYIGTASGPCTGSGQVITLNNTGVVSASCPATKTVTLTW